MRFLFSRPLRFFVLLIFTITFSTSCLKTRTQIKGQDPSEESTSEVDQRHNVKYEDEEMRNEITRLSGKVEEVAHTQKMQNYNDLKEYNVKLDNRISELEKNQMIVMSELKSLREEKEQVKKEASMPATDLFAEGFKLLADKDYDGASEKFRILTSKNLKGKDASEAHFGMGEAEFGLQNYKKAIVHYSKVSESFSKSKRIPLSLYKIGYSFKALGMNKEAKGFFSELLDRYPKSPEAKKIKSKSKDI